MSNTSFNTSNLHSKIICPQFVNLLTQGKEVLQITVYSTTEHFADKTT